MLARSAHLQSPRRAGPFVTVNCPTLSEELLASELFGHAKGAFTGAVRDQPGRVEAADGGTLFLDEIGEICAAGCRPSSCASCRRSSSSASARARTRRADVRVVAATNRDLEADVRAGRFREDLLYRLNVIEVRVPPLRERPRGHRAAWPARFLALLRRRRRHAPAASCRPRPRRCSLHYALARQRARAAQRHRARGDPVARGACIEPEAFPERIAAPGPRARTSGGDFTLEEIEREHILRVLAQHADARGRRRILGIDASTLWRKRKKYAGG